MSQLAAASFGQQIRAKGRSVSAPKNPAPDRGAEAGSLTGLGVTSLIPTGSTTRSRQTPRLRLLRKRAVFRGLFGVVFISFRLSMGFLADFRRFWPPVSGARIPVPDESISEAYDFHFGRTKVRRMRANWNRRTGTTSVFTVRPKLYFWDNPARSCRRKRACAAGRACGLTIRARD